MGRHDDLARSRMVHLPQQFEKVDLTGGRQGRFRLVENVETLPGAALFEEPQEALPVGMRKIIGRDQE